MLKDLSESVLSYYAGCINMAKKTKATLSVSSTAPKLPQATFPEISLKQGLDCRVLLEDQIFLIDVGAIPGSYIRQSRAVPAERALRTSLLQRNARPT